MSRLRLNIFLTDTYYTLKEDFIITDPRICTRPGCVTALSLMAVENDLLPFQPVCKCPLDAWASVPRLCSLLFLCPRSIFAAAPLLFWLSSCSLSVRCRNTPHLLFPPEAKSARTEISRITTLNGNKKQLLCKPGFPVQYLVLKSLLTQALCSKTSLFYRFYFTIKYLQIYLTNNPSYQYSQNR